MMRFHALTIPISVLSGCALVPAAEEVSANPELAHTTGHLETTEHALDHGEHWLDTSVEAELTAGEPAHVWTFELSAPATLTLATRGTATGPDVDTVLYLYRADTQEFLARSDDHEQTVFSSVTGRLDAGGYRVEVRARTPSDLGPFVLFSECSAGCPMPVQPRECVFGETVSNIPSFLRVSTIQTVRRAEHLPVEVGRAQLLASTAHTPVAPVSAAETLFATVDGGLVRWLKVWDDAGGRTYWVYEYRITGSSFGAIFDAETGELVARIDDRAIAQCRVPVRACLLGPTLPALRTDPRLQVLKQTFVTEATVSTLSKLERAQLLAAVRVAYPDAKNVRDALARVDAGRVIQLLLEHSGTARAVAIYEYGAGDNSYGAAFLAYGRVVQARIEDGQFTACTLYGQD